MPWPQFFALILQASFAGLVLAILLGYISYQISYNWRDGINRAETKRFNRANRENRK